MIRTPKETISKSHAQLLSLQWMETVPFQSSQSFIFDQDSIIISHSIERFRGKSVSSIKDLKGREISKVMNVHNLKSHGESAVFIWPDEKMNSSRKKLGYFVPFVKWNWTLCTVIDFEDIEEEGKTKLDKIIKVLEKTFEKIQLGETGYAFVFDRMRNIVIPPRSQMPGNISEINNSLWTLNRSWGAAGPGAAFDEQNLIKHIRSKFRDYIIQGQKDCTLKNHNKPNSLDYWLRVSLYLTATTGSILETYRQILTELGIEKSSASKATLTGLIRQAVIELVEAKKMKVALIIDEASLLRLEVFAELHTLCQFDKDSKPYLPLILAGQSLLIDKLSYRDCAPLASRVICRAHLQGLDKDGMQQYLLHHLKLAGIKKPLFDETAITAIHQGSGGLLRKANHLARGALIAAAAEKCPTVSAEHVRIAATEVF